MWNFKNINSASLTKLTNQNRYSNNATLLASDQNAAEKDSTLKKLLKVTSRMLAFIIALVYHQTRRCKETSNLGKILIKQMKEGSETGHLAYICHNEEVDNWERLRIWVDVRIGLSIHA